MKIKKSGAKYSSIVGIGEMLKKRVAETGREVLFLNRGINAVVNIDLSEVVSLIDFNSNDIQVYPPNSGRLGLREAINQVYFHNQSTCENIFVTNGGMNALDLIIRTLDTPKVYLSNFYWGAYVNILKLNNTPYQFYESFEYLQQHLDELRGAAVIICDPNNPVGTKYNDEQLLELVAQLNANGTTIIWDSPYRRLFFDDADDLYARLLAFDNVIVAESFSKSIGLSGQRIGFVHSKNEAFNAELNINLLYETNGINAFSQVLVEKILTTPEGKKAAKQFKAQTFADIQKNIAYLQQNNLLVEPLYRDAPPMGIFVVVNKSFDELLKHDIGSVSFGYFTQMPKQEADKLSRICVSVPHQKFVQFFDEMLTHN